MPEGLNYSPVNPGRNTGSTTSGRSTLARLSALHRRSSGRRALGSTADCPPRLPVARRQKPECARRRHPTQQTAHTRSLPPPPTPTLGAPVTPPLSRSASRKLFRAASEMPTVPNNDPMKHKYFIKHSGLFPPNTRTMPGIWAVMPGRRFARRRGRHCRRRCRCQPHPRRQQPADRSAATLDHTSVRIAVAIDALQ